MSPQPLAYALIAALANVLGAAAVTSRARWSMRALDVMVALSAGFMIAVSVAELLPEAIERGGRNAALAALGAATALGVATVVGVFMTQYIPGLRSFGLALSAGVTLYVAASNLVPEFQSKPGWRMPISFFAGCALFFAARVVTGS